MQGSAPAQALIDVAPSAICALRAATAARAALVGDAATLTALSDRSRCAAVTALLQGILSQAAAEVPPGALFYGMLLPMRCCQLYRSAAGCLMSAAA